MLYKIRAPGTRRCKNCTSLIPKGEICFETSSSGFYKHTICKKCITDEIKKKV